MAWDLGPASEKQIALLNRLAREKSLAGIPEHLREHLLKFLETGEIQKHHASGILDVLIKAKTDPTSLVDTYEDRITEYLRLKTSQELGEVTDQSLVSNAWLRMHAFMPGDKAKVRSNIVKRTTKQAILAESEVTVTASTSRDNERLVLVYEPITGYELWTTAANLVHL